MSEILRINALEKTFQRGRVTTKVLNGVNIVVNKGEFAIISGQSGSGKTTILNVVSGLERPSSGSVTVFGQEPYAMPAAERTRFRATKIGFVYQQANWIRSLNVVENVAIPLLAVDVDEAEALQKAMETLEKIGLAGLANMSPLELSGGEQQRVGIARALIHDPQLILADEPTGSLDTHSADRVMELFSLLNVKEGRTVVLVTHNPIYEFYATHLIEMRDGAVIRDSHHER